MVTTVQNIYNKMKLEYIQENIIKLNIELKNIKNQLKNKSMSKERENLYSSKSFKAKILTTFLQEYNYMRNKKQNSHFYQENKYDNNRKENLFPSSKDSAPLNKVLIYFNSYKQMLEIAFVKNITNRYEAKTHKYVEAITVQDLFVDINVNLPSHCYYLATSSNVDIIPMNNTPNIIMDINDFNDYLFNKEINIKELKQLLNQFGIATEEEMKQGKIKNLTQFYKKLKTFKKLLTLESEYLANRKKILEQYKY